jgi:GNAT superfamily N-acetyltransferase
MSEPIPYRSLKMTRDHLRDIPAFPLPEGYGLRTFQPGDEQAWARIERRVDEFATEAEALREFDAYFGGDVAALSTRCFFLTDAHGKPIGTASAWWSDLDGETRGEVAWVGIVPEHQGKGLAKPLLSAVMRRLAQSHERAWLRTQTISYRAVDLYLNYGFAPYPRQPEDEEGWRIIEDLLDRAVLPAP